MLVLGEVLCDTRLIKGFVWLPLVRLLNLTTRYKPLQ